MHRTPIKTGRKTGWVKITTTIPKGIYIHAMSTNTKRTNPPHDRGRSVYTGVYPDTKRETDNHEGRPRW